MGCAHGPGGLCVAHPLWCYASGGQVLFVGVSRFLSCFAREKAGCDSQAPHEIQMVVRLTKIQGGCGVLVYPLRGNNYTEAASSGVDVDVAHSG